MSYELRTDDDVADDVTLTLGSHPDGELTFKDSSAIVDDETLAQRLAERYPHLEYAGPADADGSTSADSPIDPSEYTIDDLEDTLAVEEYSAAELEAICEAEQAEKDRNGAISVIEDALEE